MATEAMMSKYKMSSDSTAVAFLNNDGFLEPTHVLMIDGRPCDHAGVSLVSDLAHEKLQGWDCRFAESFNDGRVLVGLNDDEDLDQLAAYILGQVKDVRPSAGGVYEPKGVSLDEDHAAIARACIEKVFAERGEREDEYSPWGPLHAACNIVNHRIGQRGVIYGTWSWQLLVKAWTGKEAELPKAAYE